MTQLKKEQFLYRNVYFKKFVANRLSVPARGYIYVGPSIISLTNSLSYLFLDISSRYLACIIDDIIGL